MNSAGVVLDPHIYQEHGTDHSLVDGVRIVDRLDKHARHRPDALWLTGVGTDGSTQTLTFAEAADHSRRLATWLHGRGATAGTVVAIVPTNDVRSAITVLALMRLGCTTLFLRPDEPPQRRAELVDAHRPALVLVTRPGFDVPDPRTLPSAAVPTETAPDVTLLFPTSGSTAASKIVAQPEYTAAVNAEALRRHHHLAPGQRVLSSLPICHVNGLHFTLLATLWAGAEAILLDRFTAAGYRDCVERLRPTIASSVPSLLQQLVAGPPIRFGPEFRYFVSAAAPLTASTAAAVHERLGVRVVQGYGLTETVNFATLLPTDLSEAEYRALMIDTPVPSIGAALFGNELAVLRSDGSPAELGETGEICMRGHNVMRGYAGNDDATEEAFRNGWFHSGDLGYAVLGPRGRTYYVITGRLKNMAKVLGVAVSLEEMEHRLQELPAIVDSACFTVPDRLLGESIVAVVVTPTGVDRPGFDRHLAQFFTSATLPGRYVRAKSIPRTPTGKIVRRHLPEMFARKEVDA